MPGKTGRAPPAHWLAKIIVEGFLIWQSGGLRSASPPLRPPLVWNRTRGGLLAWESRSGFARPLAGKYHRGGLSRWAIRRHP
ncbi:hypothetical protein ACFLZW_06720, partial [Chloroflexota bacterium]